MKSLLSRGRLACLVLVMAVAATSPQTVVAAASAPEKARLSKLEIIGLLQERRFDALETWILQDAKAENPGCCVWRVRAFAHSDPANQALLDAWVSTRPESFVALMARGTYHYHLGTLLRGDKTVKATSQRQLTYMRPYFLEARKDFEAALALNPRILLGYENLLNVAMLLGRHDYADELYWRGKVFFPNSPRLARAYLFSMQLKWRGDPRIFFSFRQYLVDRHGFEEGYEFLDHFLSGNELHPGKLMEWEGKGEELLAYSEARLAKWEEDATALRWRAVALERLGRVDEAEADLHRAMALSPLWDALYKDLARLYYGRIEMEKARASRI